MAEAEPSEDQTAAPPAMPRIRVEASVSVALPAAAAVVVAGDVGNLLVLSPGAARDLGMALLIAVPAVEGEGEAAAPEELAFLDA